MGITLDKLEFDSSIGHPNIASLLYDSAGNGIGSTGGSLDVNVTNASITVTATQLDIDDLDHATDSVSIGDGTEIAAVNASNELQVRDDDANTTLTAIDGYFVAEDAASAGGEKGLISLAVANHTEGALHSADGDFAFLQVDDQGRLRVIADLDFGSSIADDAVDTENPIKVGGRSVDLGSTLSEISAAGDKANFLTDMYRRQLVIDTRTSFLCTDVSVTNTATKFPTTDLNGRTEVTFQNLSSADVYFGEAGSVTTTTGMQIPKGASATYRLSEACDIYLIAATAGPHDIRVMEAV